MVENTYVSDTIDTIDRKHACDEACKKVLALKEIAARILKAVVSEYKDSSIDDIILYISDIDIASEPVDADIIPPVINSDNSEDSTVLEGKRLYDIKFTAKAPGIDREISLIINIEAQKNYNPGYSLVRRGMYYCCRLVSSQYSTVFTKSDYDKIQKVYSIWICTNPDKAHKNNIIQYSISPNQIFGEAEPADNSDYDIMSLVMICLNGLDGDIDCENDIIRLLTVLFSNKIKSVEKKAILQNEYNINMTQDIDMEVENMCNVSEMYFEDGIEKGIEKGMEEEKIKIAMNLLALGTVSKEEIAKATGLDIEQINELAAQLSPVTV